MDLRKIKKLIDMVEESGISELEVRTGEESIRIARPLLPKSGVASTAGGARSGAPSRGADVPRIHRSRAADRHLLLRACTR